MNLADHQAIHTPSREFERTTVHEHNIRENPLHDREAEHDTNVVLHVAVPRPVVANNQVAAAGHFVDMGQGRYRLLRVCSCG